MSVSKKSSPTFSLLETLTQMNELVQFLSGEGLVAHIGDLKEKTEAFNAAKTSVEPLISELNKVKKDSEDATETAKVEKDAMTAAKVDHDMRLKKMERAQMDIENSKKELEKRIAAFEASCAEKTNSLAARESKIAERQKQAEAMMQEYQEKISDLKRIAG